MSGYKTIPRYPDYEIDIYGNVRRKGSLRDLSGYSVNGHDKIKIHGKTEYISRLVAETYIPNPNDYKVVMHNDKNNQNNYVDNLKWASKSESQRSIFDRGIDVPGYKETAKRVYVVDSELIFSSIKECARYYSVSPSYIRYCINNKKRCKGDFLELM